jgi:flagellin-like hook-associated protein FlgL
MSVSGIGARSQLSVQALVDMRRQLDVLQQQLGTGKKADSYAGLGPDRNLVIGLRAQFSALASYDDAATLVGTRLDAAQAVLTRVGELRRDVQSGLRQPAEIKASGQTATQENARNQLEELLQLLNTQAGDRYLFSGRGLDQAAVESAGHILDGDGVRAGLKQMIAERAQADLGSNGLGRLAIPPAAGSVVSLSEDTPPSPFGFKLAGVSSNLTGAAVSGPSGSPASASVNLAANPNAGDTIKFAFTLPDGTSESVTLQATNAAPPAAGQFTISTTPGGTAVNLQAALAGAVAGLAQTSLMGASAIAASDNFFNAGGNPPLRVSGPPFATATALVSGTTADTVTWYTGETGTDPARASAAVRVDASITVAYGTRADENAIRRMVQNVAALAAVTFAANDAAAPARYAALTQRAAAALSFADGGQKDIAVELAGAQRTLHAAQERHRQTRTALGNLLDAIEGVPAEQVGAEILTLQTRLQASLQTTAKLYQISLVNYL